MTYQAAEAVQWSPPGGPSQTWVVGYGYAASGGSFAIGNLSTGEKVTFWGSQWSKLNKLSLISEVER